MAITFPTSLDTLANSSSTDTLGGATPTHSTQHANLNDAVEALEAKIGVNDSEVTTSLDYRVKAVETGKAASSHSHSAGDLSGVVKSVNGTTPDVSGNVAVSGLGGGDMVLASEQTVSGAKTFAATKLLLRNVADTFSGIFTTAITAARTWTFPDKDGTVAMLSDITGTNSGTNTGDETDSSIKTKLGISTLSGSNTGDETESSIKTKLGVSTLSGSNTGDQTSVTGNAGTATALATARTIDGQSFDGSANITVIAPGTHAATSKTTPVDADEIPLVDSAASNVLKKLTWANFKATLKTYFDTTYQAIDADTAKLDVAQAWTASQRSGNVTDNDASFALSGAGNNYTCTPTAAFEITFTDIATNSGKSGYLTIINGSNYIATAHANTKVTSTDLTTLSATGTYVAPYLCDGTNVNILGAWKQP